MRADRLIALMIYLQNHPKATAETLATELEVSVRTVYRDMLALSAAGIPVYAERGVGGGLRLMEDYRTDLTGLSAEEVSALLLLNIPEPLISLEAGRQFKTALAKITMAMGERGAADPARQRIYLDWAGWGQANGQQPFLQTLYQAVSNGRKVELEYLMMNGLPVRRRVEAYGLVAKAGEWYVVFKGDDRMHTKSLLDLLRVDLLEEGFERDCAFRLAEYWQQVRGELEASRLPFHAHLRVSTELIGFMRMYFRETGLSQILSIEDTEDGFSHMEVAFAHLESARTQVLGLGTAAEVIEPLALRESVRMFAETILDKYQVSGT